MTILSPTRTTPNFNPRTPRGVRRGPSGSRTAGGNISIHAPRAGRDSASMTHFFASPLFQSTRPVRGATSKKPITELRCQISIHAPRAGRDCSDVARCSCQRDFNPRAPCGARLALCAESVGMNLIFQSTRPVRGATDAQTFDGKGPAISIHAPRAGRDIEIRLTPAIAHRFQSTRPVRGAT